MTPADLDFDALEREALVDEGEGDVTLVWPKTLLALLALARRTMEAERERDAMRDALIHQGTLQLSGRRDALEAWLVEYIDKDPTS